MVFLGYESDTKSFRCIDRNTRKLTISRDVKFYEDIPEAASVEYDSIDEESDADEDDVDDLNETLKGDSFEENDSEATESGQEQSIIEIMDDSIIGYRPTVGTRYPLNLAAFYAEPIVRKRCNGKRQRK